MSSAAVGCSAFEAHVDAAAILRRRRWLAHGLLGAAGLLCAMLYIWPPERGGFYPACPVYASLHVLCPGCGATRALAALLQGRVAEAWRLNALFVALLPFAVWMAVECYRRAMRTGEFRWPEVPPSLLAGVISVVSVFTLLRNLHI